MIDIRSILNGTKTQNTIEGYLLSWKKFIEFCGSEDEAMNAVNLVKWRQSMVNETTMATNSINTRIRAVRSIINSLAEHKIVSRETKWDFADVACLPLTALPQRRRKHARVRISTTQMRTMVDKTNPDRHDPLRCMERALILVLGTTGLRVSEAIMIKGEDIDLIGNSYVIRGVMAKHKSEPRVVPLGTEAFDAIQDWLYIRPIKSEYVFVSSIRTKSQDSEKILWSDTPMSRVSAYRVIKKYGKKIGIPHIKPHDFRRFVGTQLSNKSGIRTAQKVLGHCSPDTTSKYYIMDDTPVGVTDSLF